MIKDEVRLAHALQALTRAAASFALCLSRCLARARPTAHQRLLEAFAGRALDLRLTVVYEQPPQVRLALHNGKRTEVLFDSVRGLAEPPPPGNAR